MRRKEKYCTKNAIKDLQALSAIYRARTLIRRRLIKFVKYNNLWWCKCGDKNLTILLLKEIEKNKLYPVLVSKKPKQISIEVKVEE